MTNKQANAPIWWISAVVLVATVCAGVAVWIRC